MKLHHFINVMHQSQEIVIHTYAYASINNTMTIIIAYQDLHTSYIGSDSACTSSGESSISIRTKSKCWKFEHAGLGTILCGFSGLYATGNAIRYGFHWPTLSSTKMLSSQQVIQYLTNEFAPSLKRYLHNKFLKNTVECLHTVYKDYCTDWYVIVVINKQIYIVNHDGDVEESDSNFACIGSGSETALSCLRTLETLQSPLWPYEKMEFAFEMCTKNLCDIRGPFDIICN